MENNNVQAIRRADGERGKAINSYMPHGLKTAHTRALVDRGPCRDRTTDALITGRLETGSV